MELCEQYIKYLSNQYIDFTGVSQIGENKLNVLLDKLNIGYNLYNYSNGYQATWSDDYCLVLQPQGALSKNDGLIGAFAYRENIKLELELKISTDKDKLYKILNQVPKYLNMLFVDFINSTEQPYFNLSFSTNGGLIGDVNSPNAFNTVTSVTIKQQISVDIITNVEEFIDDLQDDES